MKKVSLRTPFVPQIVKMQGGSFPYMRIKILAPQIDPLAWLANQRVYPKIYYETVGGTAQIGAVGCAHQINHVPSFTLSSASARFFGGMDFFLGDNRTWKGFPSCRYVLPLVELERRKGKTHLYVNKTSQAPDLSQIHFDTSDIRSINQKLMHASHIPTYSVWEKDVQEALQCIENRLFDKIVLARRALFTFNEALTPLAFFRSIQRSKTATLFAYQFSSDQAFIGSTPESLYQRCKRRITTAAIAGTRPRGKNTTEDRKLKKELLDSPKERRELLFVLQGIEKTLQPLCSFLRAANQVQTVQTSSLHHLFHPFSGLLKKGVEDAHIIRALHPTPAVGGHPKTGSLERICQLEIFDRGWYAAPVGWISKECAHLFVAIRSALIKRKELSLFSGTGIVCGSSPEKEWEELDQKIAQFIVWK